MIQRAHRKWSIMLVALLTIGSCLIVRAADTEAPHGHLMYVGTLDHKLLVFDEDKEAIVGEIQLAGVLQDDGALRRPEAALHRKHQDDD